jgi:hypothetical protein
MSADDHRPGCSRRAQEYTFCFFHDEAEPLLTRTLSFADDFEAIREGADVLQMQAVMACSRFRSISVARAGDADEIEWLGAWHWDDCAHRRRR